MQNTNNSLMRHMENDSFYVVSSSSCNDCPKKNTKACNDCSRKKTEAKPKHDCHQCSEKPSKKSKCECGKNDKCSEKRTTCSTNYFTVQNYFSELVHDWEKELAKYNLGIQELENINYVTEETPNGELLSKVQFIFRKGHEVITKEFIVAPKGEKGDPGDSLTWDKLTEDLKNSLKGAKGDTPVLGNIIIDYDESPCNTSGSFVFNEQTGRYDLYLTLPKLRTFQDCLDDIQSLLNQFNDTIDAKFDALNIKIDAHKLFDFSKLGLHLESDGKTLKLVYDGLTNNNSVTLLIPQQHEYTIRRVDNYNDMWNDTIELLKDGNVVNSILYAQKYKPIDWWILPYPSVILMSNGELITKKLRISAWLLTLDLTLYAYENGTEHNYLFYILTTASYVNKTTNGESMWANSWSSLKYRYDSATGILTLPENGTIEYNTEEGKNYKHIYTPGGFIQVSLFATDSRPRRCRIPVIDIDDAYGNSNNENLNGSITTYYNMDPNSVPASKTYCYIHYTYDNPPYNLTNFYDVNDNLINSWVKVGVGIATYKVLNNKKYFLGNYTKVTDVVLNDSFTFEDFNIDGISIAGTLIIMNFSYNSAIPTYSKMSQLYHYISEGSSFDNILKVVSLLSGSGTSTTERYLLTNFDNQNLIFEADEDDNNIMQVLTDGYHNNVRIVLSHGGNNNTDGVLPVQLSGNNYILSGLETALLYFNVWFDSTYGQVPMDEYLESISIQPKEGTVLLGDWVFHNGYYVTTVSELFSNTESISISEDGEYLYEEGDNNVIILNLTGKTIHPIIDGIEYIVDSYETSDNDVAQDEPAEP